MSRKNARLSSLIEFFFFFAASSSSRIQGFKISLTLKRRIRSLQLLHNIASSIQDSYQSILIC